MTTGPLASRKPDVAGIVIALALLALAGVLTWDAMQLQANVVYGLGPHAMPLIVAGGLALLAIGNLVNAFRGDAPERESMQTLPVLLILGGMAALIVIIAAGGGFIPAVTVLFVATSAAFGRRAYLADLAIGFVIGVIIYLVFNRLLTLSLPAGPLERLF